MSKVYNSILNQRDCSRKINKTLYKALIDEKQLSSKKAYDKKTKELKMQNSNKYNEKQWTFKDGVKTIDFVLVWVEYSHKESLKDSVAKRMTFEANLREEGLELEHESIEDKGLHFVKIYAPQEILQRYAEILKLRMPLKDILNTKLDRQNESQTPFISSWKNCFSIFKCFEIKPYVFPDCSHELTATYRQALDYLFDVKSPGFFTPAHKARIVEFIMQRTLYTKGGKSSIFEFGIERLVLNGVYAAAYPLHDGEWNTSGSMRYLLYNYWASFKNWYKKQPSDHIRQYFGVKIALYFVWLGFYTYMLIPASVFGVICFIISLFFLPLDKPTQDICDGKIEGVICPLCDYNCDFVNVTAYCTDNKILFIFDNTTTVFFAVFISFWAAIFLEFWKRYSAEIALRWDLSWLDEKDENPRPEYAAKLSKLAADRKVNIKLNFITNATEPSVKYWKNVFPGKLISVTTMLFLITLAIAALIAVTIIHTIARATPSISNFSSILSTCLNLACILILSPIYVKVATVLTNLELPRTQREYNGSLNVKMYLLEFINNYASIFYIAFFKGKFVGSPSHHNRIFGFRQLECETTGCMLELTKQLAIIMIGKRAFKFIVQFIQPKVKYLWRRCSWANFNSDTTQWEKDFLLSEAGPRVLFPEYLDMVLQYGFVTIFVSAFPLAPLFALINNIFEIRIDARKILLFHRRPVLRRMKDIGVWFNIIEYVSKLAVFSNAFIIAFTSNIIPRLVYRMYVSPDFGLAGYMNQSLAYMAVQDLDMKNKINTTVEYCRYNDFREPPWSEHKYKETTMFWKVLAARLIFFIIFENILMAAVLLVKWLIPDVPRTVQLQLRRRHYLVNEAIITQESLQNRKATKSLFD